MKTLTSMAVVILFLALPGRAFALASETFGNAPMVNQADWAPGVLNVVNLQSRVYSRWVNGNEKFYYRGNAQDLNDALRKFAAVKDDIRQLILLPGPEKTQSFARKTVEFDWQLHVPSGIYKAVSKRSHVVMTVYIKATKPRIIEDHKQIDKWIADLKSDVFQTRDKARQELQKLGTDAKPFLREALKTNLVLEARKRIQGLLEKLQDLDVTDLEIPKGITVLTVDDLVAVHLKGLKDTNSTVRGMAIQDLIRLVSYSDKVMPALTDMLQKEKHEWVRRVAASCLAGVGEQAKAALPALKKGLNDPDATIRKEFQTAIEQIENAKEPSGRADELKSKLAILKDIREFKK